MHSMAGMCKIILEFGLLTVKCLQPIDISAASVAYGQFCRCQFAKKALGGDWGKATAEESIFINGYTDETLDAADFIRNGFPNIVY